MQLLLRLGINCRVYSLWSWSFCTQFGLRYLYLICPIPDKLSRKFKPLLLFAIFISFNVKNNILYLQITIVYLRRIILMKNDKNNPGLETDIRYRFWIPVNIVKNRNQCQNWKRNRKKSTSVIKTFKTKNEIRKNKYR